MITALPEPEHVKSVYTAIVESKPPQRPSGRIFIDCSTIDPESSRSIARLVEEGISNDKVRFIDAPMSGGIVGAAAGTLTFMVGENDHKDQERVEPILLLMGANIIRCGKQSSGLAAKLANNYLLAINNIATAEAMNLGIRWGVEGKVMAHVLNSSTGRCWPSEVNNPVPGVKPNAPASRDYDGGFAIGLMRKDLRLAMISAKEAGARLELAERASGLYEQAEADERCRGKDFSVVYRYIGGQE